jgi:hypothetical protein
MSELGKHATRGPQALLARQLAELISLIHALPDADADPGVGRGPIPASVAVRSRRPISRKPNREHLLWDGRERRLGVIDFSDMNLSDVAFDFAELYEYGDDFVKGVYRRYSGQRDHLFLERA